MKMIRLFELLVLIVSLFIECASTECNSDPFLWAFTSPISAKKSYLFGTVHVSYEKINLTPVIDNLMASSDFTFFELNFLDVHFERALINCKFLPDYKNLTEFLDAETFRRVVLHLDYVKNSMPKWLGKSKSEANLIFYNLTEGWIRHRPVWTLLLLKSLNQEEIGASNSLTLDLYLLEKAKKLKKPIAGVEQVSDQCDPLNKIDSDQVVFALKATLSSYEQIRGNKLKTNEADNIIQNYNCGKIDAFLYEKMSLFVDPSDFKSPSDIELAKKLKTSFQQKFVVERNQKMGNVIIKKIEGEPDKTFFFALGVGKGSIIEILDEHGYQVNRVSWTGIEKALNKDNTLHKGFSDYINYKRIYLIRRNENLTETKFGEQEANLHFKNQIILLPKEKITRQEGLNRLERKDNH